MALRNRIRLPRRHNQVSCIPQDIIVVRLLQRCNILTAFQRDNPDQAIYRTTGAIQLSYGFNKPYIRPERFAERTAVSGGNALLYKQDNDIFRSMR